jgi:hypothetical protein
MQRGLVSTLAASMNNARERAPGSEIELKADGGCSVLLGGEFCAAAVTETIKPTQQSSMESDGCRMNGALSEL